VRVVETFTPFFGVCVHEVIEASHVQYSTHTISVVLGGYLRRQYDIWTALWCTYNATLNPTTLFATLGWKVGENE